jgi:Beta-ketoacyl synthase, N-terminal domain
VPERDEASFTSELAKLKMPMMPLVPRGRWHHQDHLQGLQAILTLCQRDERFRLPDADALNNHLLSNIDGEIITQGSLHHIALQSILTEQSRWDLVLGASSNAMKARNANFRYISIGEKVLIPRSVNEIPVAELPDLFANHRFSSQTAQPLLDRPTLGNTEFIPHDAVAIIGMACRYPDADSVEEFWDLINEGKCVIRKFPQDRFKPSDLHREPKGPFWGGYLRHSDDFDHRFFGISGREANSMDPQQRLCLQVAYEAMESAGYCGLRSAEFDRDVGCYIGSANDDYCDNVGSNPVSAFSLTGTLRSFISGRVSHYFGWTGPSMVLDTACSAAAVAIHTACKVSPIPSHLPVRG